MECLQSATAQRYPNLEILIIDDGSDDGSQEVIEEYAKHDRRIQFRLMPHRGIRWGQGYINDALRQATGEFFNVLDSDDKMEPEFWETVLRYFTDPTIGFVRVGMWRFGKDLPQAVWVKPRPWNHIADIIADNKVYVSSPFRMSMQRQVGDWDDNISWSDWDFWTRCVLKYGWSYNTCNEPMFSYRHHDSQLAAASRLEKHKELVDYMTEKYKDYLPGLPIVKRFGRKYDEKTGELIK